MTEEALRDALSGLHAYDTGSRQSGIHDEALRTRCIEYVNSLPEHEARPLLARIARDLYLSDEAIAQGYGLEDVTEFGSWIQDENFGRNRW